MEMAYAYMPLTWAVTLTHYLPSLLLEAGLVLRVSGAMVGLPQEMISEIPTLTADPAVATALQGTLMAFGCLASLGLLRKLGDRTWSSIWPHVILIIAFTAEIWKLEGI